MGRMLFSRCYRYFISVAECKSLTIASEKLFVTASAISKSILTLEKNLGCVLFSRNKSGVQLTEKGQALYISLKKLQGTTEFTNIERVIRSSNRRISIVTDSLECRLLDNIISNINNFNYKDIGFFYERKNDALLKLSSGEADIAILYTPSSPISSQLIYHELPITPLILFELKNTIGVKESKQRVIVYDDLYHLDIYRRIVEVIKDSFEGEIDFLVLPHTQYIVEALVLGGGFALLPDYILKSKYFSGHDLINIDVIPDDLFIKRSVIYSRVNEDDVNIKNLLDFIYGE